MPLSRLVSDARPLLLRGRVISSVLAAQKLEGEPVTSAQVRAICRGEPLMRSARSFAAIAHRIALLGPDEHGRTLHHAGHADRFALWWVEQPAVATNAEP